MALLVQARRPRGVGRRAHGAALLGGLGVGEQLPVRLGQAGRLPPRRHAQPDGRPLAAKAITDPGGLRSQFTHVIDIGPTVLEIAGIPAPTHIDGIEQEPLHGITFADSLRRRRRARAPHPAVLRDRRQPRRCTRTAGGSAMRLPRIPWHAHPEALRNFAPGVWDPDADPVELYYLPDDFSQASNLADEHPEKVEELRELFWEEAESYQVLPMLGGLSSFFGIVPPIREDTQFTYRGRIENVAAGMIPRIYNHSYAISADLVDPARRRRRRDRGRVRPPRRVRALRPGREAATPYSMLGVLEYTAGVGRAAPDRRASASGGVRRRRAEAGDRRRGHAARQRRAGRVGADGAHRPRRASRATRGWTSAATTASSSTAATPTSRRSGSRARSSRSPSTSPPFSARRTRSAARARATGACSPRRERMITRLRGDGHE